MLHLCLEVGRETRSLEVDKWDCPSLGLSGRQVGNRMPVPVGYTSFPFGLPPASISASASMLLENTFLTPSVRERLPEPFRHWDGDGGAGDSGTSSLSG